MRQPCRLPTILSLLALTSFALAGARIAADEPPGPAAPALPAPALPAPGAPAADDPVVGDPTAALRGALEALAALPTAAFEGEVIAKEGGLDAMMGAARGMMGQGGGGVPFQGEFEAYLWEGKTLLASKRRTPGFAVYHDGRSSLTRAVYRAEAPDVSQARGELLRLLDRDRLSQALLDAEWKRAEGAPAVVRLTAQLDADLLPSDDNPMLALMGGGGTGKGPGIEARVDLTSDGKIAEIRVRIRRVDTARMMMEFAQQMGVGGGGLDGAPGMKDQTEGPETVYVLRPRGTEASERLKATILEMQALAQGR